LKIYTGNECIRFDPPARRARQSNTPFEWNERTFECERDLRALEIMRSRMDFGLCQGFIIPIHGARGYEGCVSMAGGKLNLTAHDKLTIHLTALYAFDRIRRLRGALAEEGAFITPREREILAWAAEGKSARETGRILKIAKRTVEHHTQSATRKLGAVNRTQAVVFALCNHLIEA
jgi:LuxR family quorum sensing-dependent transcriptional regulator